MTTAFRTTLCLALGALAGIAASPAGADVCRWTDAEGKVHYGESPPAGVKCAKTLRAPPPPSGGATAPQPQQTEADFQRRRLQRLEAEHNDAAERAKAEQMQEACGQARGRLTWLQNGGRVARIDANGERHFLDDQEMAREMAAQQRKVSQYCR